MIGGADVVEVLVAQDNHVDLVGGAADMAQAVEELRKIRRQSDIDQDGARCTAHQVGVGSAVLETDLVDILRRLDQGADIVAEEDRKLGRLAVAHDSAAL